MNWAIWTNSFCNLDIFSLRRGSATNAALQARELCRPATDHNLVYLALRKMNLAILTNAFFYLDKYVLRRESATAAAAAADLLQLWLCRLAASHNMGILHLASGSDNGIAQLMPSGSLGKSLVVGNRRKLQFDVSDFAGVGVVNVWRPRLL